jgi:hypothetical protein
MFRAVRGESEKIPYSGAAAKLERFGLSVFPATRKCYADSSRLLKTAARGRLSCIAIRETFF